MPVIRDLLFRASEVTGIKEYGYISDSHCSIR